jgi:AraC family transcriptional regulator
MSEGVNNSLSRVLSRGDMLRLRGDLPIRSSYALNWPGIEIHRYDYKAPASDGFRDRCFPQLTIFLPSPQAPFYAQVEIGGVSVRRKFTGKSISIAPMNVPYRSKGRGGRGASQVSAIFIDSSVITEAAITFTGVYEPEIIPQISIEDPLIRAIADQLDAEVVAGGSSPRIYVESLAATLGTHVVAKYAIAAFRGQRAGALNGAQLRASIGFMRENFERDISLEELASSARMSKFHFAKSFKLALGISPHRYLVKLRMERARKMLADARLSVDEIAQAVGYSDVGHFAVQFSKCTGATPSEYRKLK